ncbi:hypothetical protein [Cystobacter fuscus]|uniref:hypothetical protein n=1 Tax=Cystobacter fuscus TaxID=43 RepID=UPI0012DC8635|nr:hypothetical protein [Cystobacter fuscus]
MTPEFILWGVAGYITLFIIQTARPSKNRSGWDFVALTAICALGNFFAASLILGGLRWAYLPLASQLASWRAALFPSPGSGVLILGLVLSPLSGLMVSRVFKRQAFGLLRWLSGTERDLEFTDVFYKMGNELLGKKVIVSLTSGKVYMGIFLQASGDPNESERSIIIQPVMSGFRSDDNQLVTFNTDYFQADRLPDIRLLLPMKNVQSISNFNDAVHATFVTRGVTKVESANRSALQSATEQQTALVSNTPGAEGTASTADASLAATPASPDAPQ